MLIMGIDIGTTTISIILMDTAGKLLKARTTVNHQSFLNGEYPEEKIQDPEGIWRITKEKMEDLIRMYGMPDGIGLTGQMHGMLYTDEEGNAVSPLYTWQDGSGNLPLHDKKSSADILKERVGAAAAGYGLTTHYYLQRKGRIPAKARKMTTISDYIAMKLCGHRSPVISADMAASFGCFDLEKKRFLYEALENVGVDTSFLPDVRKGYCVVGKTEEGVPVMAAMGDNQASFMGAAGSVCRESADMKKTAAFAASQEATALINIGTGSQISFLSETYCPCEGILESRQYMEDRYLLVGSPLCGGRAYAMLEQFYREVSGTEESFYETMYRQAREFVGRYGADAAWKVTTTFSGTRDNPQERGRIEGISGGNFHPGALTAGVIRGILEELHQQYVKMCELTGRRAGRLVGSGNGFRQNPLMQELAEEIFGLKAEIPEYQEEAACGAAMCMETLLM